MSDTSARARRFAFWLGSFARNGLIGARRAGADGWPPVADFVVPAGGGEPGDTGLAAGRWGKAGRLGGLGGGGGVWGRVAPGRGGGRGGAALRRTCAGRGAARRRRCGRSEGS